jgi:prolipoprotein diacylglyceryltransferase
MVAFSIGSLHIYRYGIFYAVGFFVGYGWLRYLSHNKTLGEYNTRVSDFLRQHLDDLMLAIML